MKQILKLHVNECSNPSQNQCIFHLQLYQCLKPCTRSFTQHQNTEAQTQVLFIMFRLNLHRSLYVCKYGISLDLLHCFKHTLSLFSCQGVGLKLVRYFVWYILIMLSLNFHTV